ncbi:prolyl oligopeptidase family serine peptidase [Proteinivorax hydrogeniformans]|uniref:Prolyl oligopeptidase family serine peptidase n=1 Tax=Proteinivorax hydrogeniformans TaxID=1826727 RepID=A0AAU8HUC9_9FIRM
MELTRKIAGIFSIPKARTILGGFSMGGYGVYRIYDYCPDFFTSLAIFSGHHSMGKTLCGGPDYGTPDKISLFKDIPMIIFHGSEDRNCPYQEVKNFFDEITKVNPNCTIHVQQGEGHSGLTRQWYNKFSKWISIST